MNIRHERPMPDLAFRMRAPLGLTLRDGTRTRVEDWSMRGVTVRDVGDRDVSDAVLAIPFQGVVISFPVYLEPGDAPDFYEFRGLNGRQRETLALFYRNLLSGRMATTEDMITALDTPVDLIPMEETEEERAQAARGRGTRFRRIATAVTIYALLFVMIFGYLGTLAWNRLNHIALDQPRFIAPIETLNAPRAAFVRDILAQPGEMVAAGDVLMTLDDPEASAQLDEIRFEINGAERALAQIQARIANHEEGRAAARRPFEQDLKLAADRLGYRPFTAGWDVPGYVQAKTRLANFDVGLSFAPRDFNDVLGQLRVLEEERFQALRLLRRERGNFKDSMDALRIVAPQDGMLSDVLVQDGQFLRAGAPLGSFEADDGRMARGWLSDRLAADVYVGMEADIIYNRGGEELRLPGRVAQVEAGMNPVVPDQYGMIVTVTALGLDADQTRQLFPVNAPVVVRLDRGWLDAWTDGPQDGD